MQRILGISILKIVERDPSLAICGIERAGDKGIDAEDNRFSFNVNFPPRFKIEKYDKIAAWKCQRPPYWSPYEDISQYDMSMAMNLTNKLEDFLLQHRSWDILDLNEGLLSWEASYSFPEDVWMGRKEASENHCACDLPIVFISCWRYSSNNARNLKQPGQSAGRPH
ncbi:hypothetical protein Ancab_009653 [Ancistrocladus abbreviatus]